MVGAEADRQLKYMKYELHIHTYIRGIFIPNIGWMENNEVTEVGRQMRERGYYIMHCICLKQRVSFGERQRVTHSHSVKSNTLSTISPSSLCFSVKYSERLFLRGKGMNCNCLNEKTFGNSCYNFRTPYVSHYDGTSIGSWLHVNSTSTFRGTWFFLAIESWGLYLRSKVVWCDICNRISQFSA